jgi:hypothetical protein
MGHMQWRHCCDVKSNTTKPQEKVNIAHLHIIIKEQFLLGAQDLQCRDKGLLDCNILRLLQRPLVYKKGWITRFLAACQRAHHIAQQDTKLDCHSKEAQALLQWMHTHKEQHTTMVTCKCNREEHENLNQGDSADDKYLQEIALEKAPYAENRSGEHVKETTHCYKFKHKGSTAGPYDTPQDTLLSSSLSKEDDAQ